MADCLKSYPRKLSSVSSEAGVREHGLFREAAVRNNLLPLQCMLCWPALTTEHWKPKPSTLWLPFESRQNSSSPVKDHIQEIVSRLGIWKHQVSFCTKWFPTFSSQGEAEGLFLYKVLTATFVAFFKRIKSKSIMPDMAESNADLEGRTCKDLPHNPSICMTSRTPALLLKVFQCYSRGISTEPMLMAKKILTFLERHKTCWEAA